MAKYYYIVEESWDDNYEGHDRWRRLYFQGVLSDFGGFENVQNWVSKRENAMQFETRTSAVDYWKKNLRRRVRGKLQTLTGADKFEELVDSQGHTWRGKRWIEEREEGQ